MAEIIFLGKSSIERVQESAKRFGTSVSETKWVGKKKKKNTHTRRNQDTQSVAVKNFAGQEKKRKREGDSDNV